ncbi:MAG: hypothetical protein SFX72_05625 [Isosphaeraceae bacterium]|nr:hypothetical protein [Isosphaeraceae bacterium]
MRVARFVVLEHRWNGVHWDLMIESSETGPLLTWALESEPTRPGPVACRRSADHRRVYLDHDGPVSGGRGVATRWDAGLCAVESEAPDRLEVRFSGDHLRGSVALRTTSEGAGGAGSGWVLEFEPRSGDQG